MWVSREAIQVLASKRGAATLSPANPPQASGLQFILIKHTEKDILSNAVQESQVDTLKATIISSFSNIMCVFLKKL